jgi:uncharacterized OB-fold protein
MDNDRDPEIIRFDPNKPCPLATHEFVPIFRKGRTVGIVCTACGRRFYLYLELKSKCPRAAHDFVPIIRNRRAIGVVCFSCGRRFYGDWNGSLS